MMTQRNELDSDRHLNMNTAEFLEAFCRVADKTALPKAFPEVSAKILLIKVAGEYNMNEAGVNQETTLEQKKKFKEHPYHLKIESFLYQSMKLCCPKYFADEHERFLVRYYQSVRKL
jgi:hypothetical protein